MCMYIYIKYNTYIAHLVIHDIIVIIIMIFKQLVKWYLYILYNIQLDKIWKKVIKENIIQDETEKA